MDSRRNPLAVLRTVVDTVFRRDLALRRDGRGLRLVLQGPADGPDLAPSAADLERRRLEQELLDARADLTRLLDEDVRHRATMRQLATVEHALGRIGWQAFDRLPLDLLQRALQQLEDAVTNWSARGLAGLRSRLAVAVAARAAPAPAAAPSAGPKPPARAVMSTPSPARPPTVAAQAIDKARRQAAASPLEPNHDDADRALLAAYAGLVAEPRLQPADEPDRR